MDKAKLRKKAEKFLKSSSNPNTEFSNLDLLELVSELQTYQVELEMQNEELIAANVEIERSKESYENLYNFAPVGLMTLDAKGIIVETNRVSSELLGVTRDRLIGENITTFIAPDDQAIVQNHLSQVLESNTKLATELKVHNHPPGVSHLQLETVIDHSGPATHGFYKSALIDITQQKRKTDKIRKLSHIVEGSPISILITDPSGNIEYANPSLLKTSGYSLDEVMGKKPSMFKSGESPRDHYKKMWRKIEAGDDWRGVFHNKAKNGKLYWESVLITPIINAKGNVTNYVALKENISEKKKLESTLIDHERLIRAVVNNLNEGLIISNMDGNIQLFNKGSEKIFGYKAEEVMGKPVEILMDESYKEKHDIGFARFKKTQKISPNNALMEVEARKKDGSPVSIEINLTQMEQRGESLVVGLVRDISERKNAEAELKILQEELLSAQKLAAIGELAAGVSHEVLNPVNIISVHNQMLQRKTKDDPEIQNFCTKLSHEINRIQKIMSSLLAFSRKNTPQREKGIILEEVEKVLTLVEDEYKLDNIQIIREWCHNPIEVWYDPDKIRQVFLNLIHNSKFALPTGGTITVGSSAIRIKGKEFLQIKFRDTGTGMSEEVKKKIFEPFFTTKAEGEGTGMGLAVIHGIIQECGGTIAVESEEGKGTTFIINFPASE
ncbi:MAG: nitrogen fixation negative regulator NifL [Nitrospinales bacterium]|jgi:nitrogen fixation negative regulator NifL